MRDLCPALVSRREFTSRLLRASSALLAAPALVRAQGVAPGIAVGGRPAVTFGVMSGDVTADSAVIWSRADRPARMLVEWSTTESFTSVNKIAGPLTGPEADFTAKLLLRDLPAGERIFYRVRFEDVGGKGAGEPAVGQLVTAPRDGRDVFFAWSGDTCGQGFGTNPERNGMKTYAALRAVRPDFFIHSGDTIYADNPVGAGFRFADGTTWRNLVADEKAKVAETLAEFRAAHRYNLFDENVRAFNAVAPVFAQWDDHEVRNNWYPGQKLPEDPRYREKDVNVLAARARQAFFDYQPVRPSDDSIIYRTVPRGPLCEIFFLDLRSYRGPNNPNLQRERNADSAFMGETQLAWLKRALLASRSVWKIICTDMPLALLVPDGNVNWEAWANGDNGGPLGRELEIADLLRFLKTNRIRNTLWLTADVHYAASHHYDPTRAKFTEFDPFWEFVSGPLHAGTFGPNPLDQTFGPEAKWNSRPFGAPAAGPHTAEQFFGTVRIEGKTKAATVTHFNRDGVKLQSHELPAQLS
jgi:alkaline phosphatase D